MPQRVVYSDFELRTSVATPDPIAAAAIDWSLQGIERAQRICDRIGANFVLLLVPSILFVDRDMFESVFAIRPELDRKRYSIDRLHQRVVDFATAKGIVVCNPLESMRIQHGRGELLYHQESHWTARGHAVAAQLLFDLLKTRNWL